ncbi:MAG: hypothetical protein HC854_10300 [Flavobacterium sp.]|nr:hypothetical protein [Flavobacterium sp.]
MMKLTRNSVLVALLFFTHLLSLKAQENTPKIASDLSILIDKSSTFKSYKVIEKSAVLNFQLALNKYIQQQQNNQVELKNKLDANEKMILGLQNQLKEYKSTNETLVNEKASISFLGISIGKNTYSTIMWTLFLGTLLILGILFLKYKDIDKINKNSKSVLKDLEEEYESYRRVCIEREQTLRRELFTEKKKK